MLAAALLALVSSSVSPAAVLELRDQRGRTGGLADHRGHAAVAFVVDARKLRAVRGWEEDLRRLCPDARSLRVADVPRRPAATYEDVARKLAGRVPAGVSVLVDLDGAWASALGLDVAEVNALVFDGEGRETARVRGKRSDRLVGRVADALAALGTCRPGTRP